MANSKRILIVGGGIGGLSAAISLHNKGINVEVIERSVDWTVYHVGIIVQANFMRALGQLGLADEAVNAGFPYKGVRFLHKDGSVAAVLPGEPDAASGYPADLGLTRPALHKVLTDRVKLLGIPVRLGVTYESITDLGHQVDVRFSDESSGSYDLLIAADGNYSKIRTMLFPDAPTPSFTGQGVWRYNLPRPEGVDWAEIYLGKEGGKAGYVPLTKETLYVLAVFEEPGNPRFPRESLAAEFRQRLEGYGGALGQFRDMITDPELVVYRPLEICMMPAPWHKGRIVLIGDAAHSTTPHLGQGAAMALEDAVVLSEELAKEDATIAQALQRYMQRRFERASLVGHSSIKLGHLEMHPDEDGDPVEITDRIRKKLAEPI